MRIFTVVGARPNFIKVAPLMPAFHAAGFDAQLVHTGQHYDTEMSEVFFEDLQIPKPAWFLGVGSGTHAVQTAKAMIALEELLLEQRPDLLMVVGDVNSTLAGALAASKIGVPVVHLEAGLRSRDMSMPEEVNRLVTDQLSAMLLTPTHDAGENLIAEGISSDRIHFVGNVMAESLRINESVARARRAWRSHGVGPGPFVVATVHRPENTDTPERIDMILSGLARLDTPVLFPVHPRTRPLISERVEQIGGTGIQLIDPVGYLDMLSLIADAQVVVTDSGGVQEETCLLGTPCVTVRRNTEREITVALGANRLVAADADQIAAAVEAAVAAPRGWDVPARWDDGVSGRVVAALQAGIVPLKGQ